MVERILESYLASKRDYDRGLASLAGTLEVAAECLESLRDRATLTAFGCFSTADPITYHVARDGAAVSRPFRPEFFTADPATFRSEASVFVQALASHAPLPPEEFDKVIYTAVTAFSLCVDIWRPKSRKTPGTYFEVLIGSAARVAFPRYALTKHIPIRDVAIKDAIDGLIEDESLSETAAGFSGDSVSTDLVITNPQTQRGAIIPLKITTRERIVQPFAHQRILDSAYPNQFASFVACISEVQRDDKTNSVKQICVPGTIALFQKHLAKINGLYYCDVPRRYAAPDFVKVIPVKRFHSLFVDISAHLLAH